MAGNAASLKDIKIAIHVVYFVVNPPQGRSLIGIVYDPRNKESADDAQSIFDTLSTPTVRGGAALKPVLLDIRELDDAVGLRAAIATDNMKPYFDKLSHYGRRTGTLIIATDLDCVRAAKCTVGIASSPRAEVIVSSQQAQASGIVFSEAFRMMITEY